MTVRAEELGRSEVVFSEPPALRPDGCTEVGRTEGPGRDWGKEGEPAVPGGSGRGRASCVGLEARTHSGATAGTRALRRRSRWASPPLPARRRTPGPGLGAELPLPPPRPALTPPPPTPSTHTPDRNSRSAQAAQRSAVSPRRAWCGPCHLRRRHERGLIRGDLRGPGARPSTTPAADSGSAAPGPRPSGQGQAPGAARTAFSFDASARRTDSRARERPSPAAGIALGGASAGTRPIRDPTSVLPSSPPSPSEACDSFSMAREGKGSSPPATPQKTAFPALNPSPSSLPLLGSEGTALPFACPLAQLSL